MTTRAHCILFLLLLAALTVSGCNGDDGNGDTDTTSTGDTNGGADTSQDPAAYFSGSLSAALGATGNQSRCSTCHSDDGTQAGFSGYSMKDSAFLDNYKGGSEDFLGATNYCIEEFMGGNALTADDASYQSIKAYTESISDPSVTAPRPEEYTPLENQAAYGVEFAGGDVTAGETAFNTWCAKCHTRQLKLGVDAALTVETIAFYTEGRIAQKVRTSTDKFISGTADATDETPGPMPFFLPNILSDDDLRDIVAYLRTQQ